MLLQDLKAGDKNIEKGLLYLKEIHRAERSIIRDIIIEQSTTQCLLVDAHSDRLQITKAAGSAAGSADKLADAYSVNSILTGRWLGPS